jgi:hypothetical protein
MSKACKLHTRDENCIQNFWKKMSEGKIPLDRSTQRWKKNIKMDMVYDVKIWIGFS